MMNTMKALIKREFWEHRGAFIKAPVIISIVLFVLSLGVYITGMVLANKSGTSDLAETGVRELSKLSPEKLVMFWDIQMMSVSSLYLVVLFFVLFFFLLGSLFDDRKDQSILFWKSLPISDASTVISKLLTAMFFVPLVFVFIFLLSIIAIMLLYSVILLFHGLNPIQLVWSPASLFSGAKIMLLGIMVQMLWTLPIYGWLIFSSSISKRRPFLFAVFVPSIFAFSWYWVNVLTFKFTNFSMFKEPLNYMAHGLLPYASGSVSGQSFHFNPDDGTTISMIIDNMLSSLASIEILYGAIFATIMTALSIWLRRYRNTT